MENKKFVNLGREVHRGVMFAQKLGSYEVVLRKLALERPSSILGTLHGKPVTGLRFTGQPHVSSDFTRFVPFVGFPATDEAAQRKFFQGDGGEWSPMDLKMLEYVEWDISGRSERPEKVPKAPKTAKPKTTKKTCGIGAKKAGGK